jgi:hypothetical protein
MADKFVARIVDVKGAFLKGRLVSKDEVLLLEVPQGFRWVYDRLGEEMQAKQRKQEEMGPEETMKRAQLIFQCWMDKPIGEKLQILRMQRNPKGGSDQVLLKMQKTIYGSVQAAQAFWIELQKAFQAMGYRRSEADPSCIINGMSGATSVFGLPGLTTILQ